MAIMKTVFFIQVHVFSLNYYIDDARVMILEIDIHFYMELASKCSWNTKILEQRRGEGEPHQYKAIAVVNTEPMDINLSSIF